MGDIVKKAQEHKNERIADVRILWERYQNGIEEPHEELGDFHDYGLAVDIVEQNGKEAAFLRYQLSWGGGQEEFRFYPTKAQEVREIEFWYLDWFEGHGVTILGDDYKLMEEIFHHFAECLGLWEYFNTHSERF